ncbi:putative conserved secreted protein [Synechococcus sp. BIOS-E4-1]|nr:putative conserved secreted protein [Synechococcus sp. BIOS-E4-1]
MKYHALFGVLLLSASPAIAEDLIYLECDVKATETTIQSSTNEILEKRDLATVGFYKIDTINSRLTSDNSGDWEDATIANGIATGQFNEVENGVTVVGKALIEFSPPGVFNMQYTASQDDILLKMVMTGTCQDTDRETAEKGMNQ